MIYAIRFESNGPVKIGYTSDFRRRLSQYQVGSPAAIQTVALFDGDRTVEAAIHERLSAHRLRGEWFSPAPEVLDHLAAQTPVTPTRKNRGAPKTMGLSDGEARHRAAFAKALRARIGNPPAETIEALAETLEVTGETIGNWLAERSTPNWLHVAHLHHIFGDTFLGETYSDQVEKMRAQVTQRREADLARAAQEEALLIALTGESE